MNELSQKKRKAYVLGMRAETAAALWLRLKFYRILARLYRVQGGEVDIIASRGSAIVFVEVKARGSLEAAMESITPQKRRHIARAAGHWLARNPWAVGRDLRFDAVFLAPRRLPRHVIAAIELDLG
jgi:putative endonuclease